MYTLVLDRGGTISARIGLFVAEAFQEVMTPMANSAAPCLSALVGSLGEREEQDDGEGDRRAGADLHEDDAARVLEPPGEGVPHFAVEERTQRRGDLEQRYEHRRLAVGEPDELQPHRREGQRRPGERPREALHDDDLERWDTQHGLRLPRKLLQLLPHRLGGRGRGHHAVSCCVAGGGER